MSRIPIASPDLTGNEAAYLAECIQSGWISSKGPFVDRFEKGFAGFCGTSYAVSTSNGTAALHLALTALGISPGDEVIMPDLTFVASANAIVACGAKPVLVDIEKDTWCIDAGLIEKHITKKTKAIMVVHLYGHPADMQAVLKIAKKHKLHVIEDAAEAHGAEVRTGKGVWKKVGSIGDVGCFSFYGNKIITTGEGGMVVTSNKKLYEYMRVLRDHGQDPNKRYYHRVIGFNYRMTNMQAAIGVAQLERIDSFLAKKREIAASYKVALEGIAGVTCMKEAPWAKSAYWMFGILVDSPYILSRDKLLAHLSKNGVESRPFFYPVHMLPPYKSSGSYPVAQIIAAQGISLPSGVTLTRSDISDISTIIKTAV